MMSHRDVPQTALSKEHFSVIEILGKGGFGKVYKVEYRKNRTIYAVKEMSKAVYLLLYLEYSPKTAYLQ
jgi:serine/threonine protein kinase